MTITFGTLGVLLTHLLDVQPGVRLNLGLSSSPIFLTDRLILHTHYTPNGQYRRTAEQRIYDLSERSDVKSALATVFSRGLQARRRRQA